MPAAKPSIGSHDLRFENKKLRTKVKSGGKMRQARESFVDFCLKLNQVASMQKSPAEKSNQWGI